MKNKTFCICICILCFLQTAFAELQSCDVLEAALSQLPENHTLIRLYNEKTDSLLTAQYKGGVPYYFAGVNENLILRQRYPQQESAFYKADRMYFYGFDCKGYTRWAYRMQGLPEHPPLATIFSNPNCLQIGDMKPTEYKNILQVGDLFIIRKGTHHVMMYIGTLRDYGLTEHAQMQAFLDYPLVIHCGNNPFYHDWYLNYIHENKLKTFPPDGGVTVSLLYVEDTSTANVRKDVFGSDFYYFLLENSIISLINLKPVTMATWWRGTEPIPYSIY